MTIHGDHPFVPPAEERDPVRRLRGRLAAGVTLLTAGEGERRAGITVSSILVVEGEPGRVAAVVGDLTDFRDVVVETGAFVVAVLDEERRELADRFAGIRPSPGGLFAAEEWVQTEWGPRHRGLADWAGCRVEREEEVGYQRLLLGTIERLTVSDLANPLVYFRGAYRGLR